MPGWWAGVGTQALVILVSHLASPQYVLLLFSATKSVCEGKLCYKATEGNAVAFIVLFQPTQLTARSSSLPSPEQSYTEAYIVVKNKINGIVEHFRFRVTFNFKIRGSPIHVDHVV